MPGGRSAISGARSLSFACSRGKTCPECGGDGYFELVVPQDNYIIGTQEIFEKEECQKCKGKGVIDK